MRQDRPGAVPSSAAKSAARNPRQIRAVPLSSLSSSPEVGEAPGLQRKGEQDHVDQQELGFRIGALCLLCGAVLTGTASTALAVPPKRPGGGHEPWRERPRARSFPWRQRALLAVSGSPEGAGEAEDRSAGLIRAQEARAGEGVEVVNLVRLFKGNGGWAAGRLRGPARVMSTTHGADHARHRHRRPLTIARP